MNFLLNNINSLYKWNFIWIVSIYEMRNPCACHSENIQTSTFSQLQKRFPTLPLHHSCINLSCKLQSRKHFKLHETCCNFSRSQLLRSNSEWLLIYEGFWAFDGRKIFLVLYDRFYWWKWLWSGINWLDDGLEKVLKWKLFVELFGINVVLLWVKFVRKFSPKLSANSERFFFCHFHRSLIFWLKINLSNIYIRRNQNFDKFRKEILWNLKSI